ncbi:MAG TPA: hypothetical protein VNI35_00755 [Nitrospira sp.]|nr:hypothetical protein [Nitrospira sp.]
MVNPSLNHLLIAASLCWIIAFQVEAEPTPQTDTSIEELPAGTLIYVSDYFSFVGRDSQGHVAFALDTNRGRDGDAFQAEHFLVLHDERQGWITLAGSGAFDNMTKELRSIPDSPYFQFRGTPRTGMMVTSGINRLTLRIEPIPQRTSNRHRGAATWMGSAPAVLTWNGRTIAGRVIYEYVMMPEFNRLTRTYWGMWNDFHGLYMIMDKSGDLYVHSQLSERIAPLVGTLGGFAAFNERTESMKDLTIEVLDRSLALGFYRWPTAWRITWMGPEGPATLNLTQSERHGIANWVFGGFSMGIVRGDLEYAGKTYEIYGLSELIM